MGMKKATKIPSGMSLTQVIVNTDGLARTVTQKRDELGRFVKGARVSTLLAPTHIVHMAADSKNAVVMVSHHYNGTNQTVMSVNRNSGKGNAVTFVNDGSTTSLHDSIFGGK